MATYIDTVQEMLSPEHYSRSLVIADYRAADMPIVHATDSFLRLTGYARSEVMGRNCRFLQGPDSDPLAIARIREALREQTSLSIELMNYRKDGTPLRNQLILKPMRDSRGEVSHFAGLLALVDEHRTSDPAHNRPLP